jgi:hypothetical protein
VGFLELGELMHLVNKAEDVEDAETSMTETQKEALVMTMKEVYARYHTLCPFKPGDLITPRAGFNYRGAGEPQIVLEVLETPLIEWDSQRGTTHRRCDMKIAMLCGCIGTVLVESFAFEAYVEPNK